MIRLHAPLVAICLSLVDTAALGQEPISLTGTWAQRIVNSQRVRGPLGEDVVVVTTLSRQQLEHTGSTVDVTTEVCSVSVTPYKGERTIFPARAVSAIRPAASRVTLPSATIGARWVPPQRVLLIGWTTPNPATDPLPSSADDPRVIDADEDGHPGVTMHIKGLIHGDVYIVNRFFVDVSAIIKTPDRIEGLSTTAQAQHVLGASTPLLRGDVTSSPNDTGTSRYEMVRLPEGHRECSQIVDEQKTLFP